VLSGQQVVVTGGQGFIGRRVAALLTDAGAKVICPYRPDQQPDGEAAGEHVPAELLDPAHVQEVLEGADLVVHLAAQSGGIQFQRASQAEVFASNQQISANVLRAAGTAGVRRVFLASSAVVYSRSAPDPIGEDGPFVGPGRDSGVTGYAWSKLTDEVLAAWWGQGAFEVVVGRLTSVYGAGGSFDPARSTVIHALIRKAAEAPEGGQLEVWGDGSAVRSFIHVDDAAAAIVRILADGEDGLAYNVDCGDAVAIREVAALVRERCRPDLELVFDPSRPTGVPRRVLDTTRLRALGFAPAVPLADGVAATYRWYRSQQG
jgi:GDP-L-fucose synthase